jgi:hypothetical protein
MYVVTVQCGLLQSARLLHLYMLSNISGYCAYSGQADSRRLRSQVIWNFWSTKWHWDGYFFPVLRFPLPILIPPTAPYSSIIRGWYSRPTNGLRIK